MQVQLSICSGKIGCCGKIKSVKTVEDCGSIAEDICSQLILKMKNGCTKLKITVEQFDDASELSRSIETPELCNHDKVLALMGKTLLLGAELGRTIP